MWVHCCVSCVSLQFFDASIDHENLQLYLDDQCSLRFQDPIGYLYSILMVDFVPTKRLLLALLSFGRRIISHIHLIKIPREALE